MRGRAKKYASGKTRLLEQKLPYILSNVFQGGLLLNPLEWRCEGEGKAVNPEGWCREREDKNLMRVSSDTIVFVKEGCFNISWARLFKARYWGNSVGFY